jgi:membrane associated rhomboid family serine protease
LPLARIWTDRRVVAFLAVWLGLNLIVGLVPAAFAGEDVGIAWEAHIGGFVFGLLAFSLFDPPRHERVRRAIAEVERNQWSQ